MGTIVSYRGAKKLFAASLAQMAPLLREGGYCAYINLDMIVNEQGVGPLEFTSRFGYPGFAICEALSFRAGMSATDHPGFSFAVVERRGEHLLTNGQTGYVGVATGTGPSMAAAWDAVYALARQQVLPNLRYRTDIRDRVARSDLRRLAEWGWLDDAGGNPVGVG